MLLIALLCSGLLIGASAHARELVEFAPPDFLTGPSVSRAALGATYDYRGREPYPHAALQITVVAIPQELRHARETSAEHCVALFVDEIRKRTPDLFVMEVPGALQAGPVALAQTRWSHRAGPLDFTGVTSCGIHQGRYVSVNFQDTLKAAPASFTAIRSRLRDLELPP